MKVPQSLNFGYYLSHSMTYPKTWIFKSLEFNQEQIMGELNYIYLSTVVWL